LLAKGVTRRRTKLFSILSKRRIVAGLPTKEAAMKALLLTTAVVVASLLSPSAQAEDKTIKMKLITKTMHESGGGYQVFGVTFQENGTIGTKDFFVKPSGNKDEYVGLSTYTFEDGTITAAFRGWPEKGREIGSYMIQTGTGKYAGAKGGGGFEGQPDGKSALKGVGIWDITLNVSIPAQN
jgi:hypothetical protein